MFTAQIAAAISGAKTYPQFNSLSAAIWKAHAAGLLDDAAAQAAAEALQARKALVAGVRVEAAQKRAHGLPRRSAPRSPDREASVRRRRACAASGAVPSTIAAAFTTAELSVLSAVAAEVRRAGSCSWPIDRIAALAGVCRRTAQIALRHAEKLGLVHIHERPRPGQKHLPSVVTVISPEWRAWLRIGHRVQKHTHHGKGYKIPVQECSNSAQSALTHSRYVPSCKAATPTARPPCTPTPPRSPSKTPPTA